MKKENRNEIISRIYELVWKAIEKVNYTFIREAFTLALDYNSENYGNSEIFLSETDDGVIIGDDIISFNGLFN